MQFKHPELLWALFLLLIPIIIHLFQLRRFQKVEFTNVKFLKKVSIETRKSSQIKKWLTLLTRLLVMASIVFAFAQPFIANSDDFNATNETVIYLDNSYSMQAKGNNGSLLNEVIQDIINNASEDEDITIFTNDHVFKNTTVKAIRNELIQLKHSSGQIPYQSAYLKGKQYFSKDASSIKNLVLLSDFQQKSESLVFESDSSVVLKLVQPKAITSNNVSIDSAYISTRNNETFELNVILTNHGEAIDRIPVSLFNNEKLLAKTAVDIDGEAKTTFTLPNNEVVNGMLSIEDTNLQYDNHLFFNINKTEKIKVLSINNASDNYLKRLYTDDEFDYVGFQFDALNYNVISEQNLIILNALNTIPSSLITALKAFKSDGGYILIIPSNEIDLNSYNQLFKYINISNYDIITHSEKRITNINYDHPLIADAFYNRVRNFQYPKVNSYYTFVSKANAVLTYEDGSPFLMGYNGAYAFSAPINEANSNFKSSPLIVPVLYGLGKQSLKLSKLYYTIGQKNTIDIKTVLGQDDILTLATEESSVIPLQQTFSNTVKITTDDYPKEAGILAVKNHKSTLQNLSFNYSRDESQLTYHKLPQTNEFTVDSNLTAAIERIKSNTNINALWKWFVIFALAFLMIEMFILKYLK